MEKLPRRMYAGIVEDQVYVLAGGVDEFAPVQVALFRTEAEARSRFERVVTVDTSKMFAAPPSDKKE